VIRIWAILGRHSSDRDLRLSNTALKPTHIYGVRPRKDHRGVDLIFDALPFGRLWYGEPNAISNAIDYAKHRSRTHRAVIRIYDEAGAVIETHEHAGVPTRRKTPFYLTAGRIAQ